MECCLDRKSLQSSRKLIFPFRGLVLFSNFRTVRLFLLLHKSFENMIFTTAANISPLNHVIIAKYCVQLHLTHMTGITKEQLK